MIKQLLIIFALLIPMSSSAGFVPENVWFCKAVGNIEGQPVVVLTDIWADDHENDYEIRQAHFAHYVMLKTKGKFRPSFVASCRDYTDAKRAYKHRKLEIELAERYHFNIMEVVWSYTPNDKPQITK